MADPIRIDGLAQFSRSLKQLDTNLPKALRVALNDSANLVVDHTTPRFPRRTGRAARTLKPKSTRTAVRVSEGDARTPYVPWLDFGGKVGRRKSVARPFYKDGRFLFKSYRDLKQSGEFESVLTKALLNVAEQAGLEVD